MVATWLLIWNWRLLIIIQNNILSECRLEPWEWDASDFKMNWQLLEMFKTWRLWCDMRWASFVCKSAKVWSTQTRPSAAAFSVARWVPASNQANQANHWIRSIWSLHFHSVKESVSWSRVAFLESTHKSLQIFQGFGYHWLEEIACIICTWLSVAKNLGEISLASKGCKKLILFQLGKHCTRSFVMQIRGFCFFNECHPPNPLQRSRCFQSLSNSIKLIVRVSVKGNQHQEQLACFSWGSAWVKSEHTDANFTPLLEAGSDHAKCMSTVLGWIL